MRRAFMLMLLLCILLLCAARAEDLTGLWGFEGGAEVHGDGFVLYADGSGEVLEALSYDYFPISEFLHTGSVFTWEVQTEGEKLFLIEEYPDGTTRRWEIQRLDDSGKIHIPEGDGGGFYWPIAEETAVIAENPLDTVADLQAQRGNFSKNKRYEVWQGPGAEYGRSGGGKGTVSTNGPINCYGTWNEWLLIEYEISTSKHRCGWIRLSDLPQKQQDDYAVLEFGLNDYGQYNYGVLIQPATLTDDPYYSKNAVIEMPAGTSVRVLAKTGEYLLVDGFVGRARRMGFVHESYVDLRFGYAENAVCTIDEAITYTEADIRAAAEAVKANVCKYFSGMGVVTIKYIEAESADADDWWQPVEENREGMQLFVDLSSMELYDGEIAGFGVAQDYGFILYRDKDGGAWEVCNWGYE